LWGQGNISSKRGFSIHVAAIQADVIENAALARESDVISQFSFVIVFGSKRQRLPG
jgi:hypothetical protein